jgi:RND family efflux transporter MFP subunit
MKWFPSLLILLPSTLLASTPVTIKSLDELWFTQQQSAPASVIALNAPVISAELNARVVGIHAETGDKVSAGDLLVELDCRRAEADLNAAEAVLRQFEAQYDFAHQQVRRADDLLEKQSISDQEVDQRKSEELRLAAQIDGQKATIRQAMIQVENCRVTAPFDAIVTQRMADRGMLATTGTPLLKLLETGALEVSARLNTAEIESLSNGSEQWFETGGNRYPVRLRGAVPLLDESTRTSDARFRFADDAPVAGSAGRLIWALSSRTIPAEYLVRRNGQLGIFLMEDGKAHFRKLDDALEGRPAIVELPASTLLIVEGRDSLNDGDTVSQAQTGTGLTQDGNAPGSMQ